MRRMDEIRITIMIIVWWYSDTFLSLPIILFSFYLLAFQCFHAVIICLPVIPWGWLHSFRVSITFHAVFIGIFFTRCAWLTSLCGWLTVIFSHLRDWRVFFQPGNQGSHDFLVLPGRRWQSICFSCRDALLENVNLLVDCLFGSKISWTPYIFKMEKVRFSIVWKIVMYG
jgi:hypothetical protein